VQYFQSKTYWSVLSEGLKILNLRYFQNSSEIETIQIGKRMNIAIEKISINELKVDELNDILISIKTDMLKNQTKRKKTVFR